MSGCPDFPPLCAATFACQRLLSSTERTELDGRQHGMTDRARVCTDCRLIYARRWGRVTRMGHVSATSHVLAFVRRPEASATFDVKAAMAAWSAPGVAAEPRSRPVASGIGGVASFVAPPRDDGRTRGTSAPAR